MQPLELPAGVVSGATPAAANGSRWREANLIRWFNNRAQPVGGWARMDVGAFASPVRAILPWITNAGVKYVGIMCESNLYVLQGNTLIDITPADGIASPSSGTDVGGYGAGIYGAGDYGTARPANSASKPLPPCYTLDNWGDTLLAMTSVDGRLLQWDPASTAGTKAAAVTSAPISNRTFVVTPLRFVIVFQKGGNNNKLGWCDQEDLSNWALDSIDSLAGEYDIEPAAPIIAPINCIDGVLVFTIKKAYLLRYVGDPFIYSLEEVGDAPIPITNASLVNSAVGPLWFSESGFWNYNGGVITPVACDIWGWISENINTDWVRFVACACVLSSFGEYWWFFPGTSSQANTKVAIFNFRTRIWSMGTLSRTAGSSATFTSYPIMSNGTDLFRHEIGNTYGDSLPWLETYSLNLGNEKKSTITQMLMDISGDVDKVRVQLVERQQRARGVDVEGPLLPVRSDGFVDARQTALDFRLRIKQVVDDGSWSVGPIEIDAKARGVR